jgi:hypothetical protein
LYYFVSGVLNCQVLKKIKLLLSPEKINLPPTPVNSPEGFYGIQISFNTIRHVQRHVLHMALHIKYLYTLAKK